MSRSRPHARRSSLGLAALAAVALLATPLSATGAALGDELPVAADTALSDTGLSDTALSDTALSDTAGPTQQHADDRLADRITDRLGADRSAGAYLDDGDLVVTVTDRAAVRAVRSAGATPRQVRFSTRMLDRTQETLDEYAVAHGAGTVQGWYVDVRSNRVVVTAARGAQSDASRQFLRKARSLGDRVTIERLAGKPRLAAYLYGGQQVNMSNGYVCSLGFNARTSSGAYAFVTAGHCAEGYPTFSRNGVTIGGTRGYSFPTNDYASVNINDPAYWNPQGAVDMYNGYARIVSGQSQAPVGSTLCKSGRTTGWTCGRIQAYNQTVNYGGGDIVYGLVRHSACVEQGDSGGSNLSGNYAQGVSSGAQLYQSGGRLVCGEKVGQATVSWYQPIGEALNAYGLSLVTG